MRRFTIHIIAALLSFLIGLAAYLCLGVFGSTSSALPQAHSSEIPTRLLVIPATSKETAILDYDAYLYEHCSRRNPEKQRILEAKSRQQLKK
jgi:hypothetical protein